MVFTPPKRQPTAEWISDNFHLPSVSGDIDGLYDFYYAPYFLGVAKALDDPQVKEVDLMKAAQIGWTYFLLAYIFKRVREAVDGVRCPIMMLFAKEMDGKRFYDQKLCPAVPVNPAISDVINVSQSRRGGNSWSYKSFPNGFLSIVSSNSPGNVKSASSIAVGIIEEPDDTSDNVKDQGDSIGHIEERVKRTADSKIIVGGTPALKGFSKVEQRVNLSDARVLPIACHECGDKHVLDFENVHWVGKDGAPDVDEDTGEILTDPHEVYGFAQPDTAVYVCPTCGEEWDDYQRQKNIRDTVFNAVADGDPLCGWVPTKPFHGKAGFVDLGEVYTCLPGSGLAELVREYLNAEHLSALGDQTKKIKFVNQKLGRPYEFKGDMAAPEALRDVAMDYAEGVIPHGGLMLTAGIDVQHNRIAVVLRAWGRDESWCIYWGELTAAVTTVDIKDPVWATLEHRLFGAFKAADGWTTHLSALTIDASDGTTSDAVYTWVRRMSKKYRNTLVMAGKGSSSQTDPEIFRTPSLKGIDHRNPAKQTKADRHGVKVFIVGTNKAKDWISGQMRLEIDPTARGRWHFYKDIRADYFEQITGEVKVPHRRIRNKKTWQQKAGCAVEAWDCEVYALHAARARRVHLLTPNQWDEIENKLKQVDLFSEAPAAPEQPATKTNDQPAARSADWIPDTTDDWI
jgi:phage terminase large subunit GpA-like protein